MTVSPGVLVGWFRRCAGLPTRDGTGRCQCRMNNRSARHRRGHVGRRYELPPEAVADDVLRVRDDRHDGGDSVPAVDSGGLDKFFHSAYGVEKMTLTRWASAPCSALPICS